MAEVTTRTIPETNNHLKNMIKHEGNSCGQEATRVTSGPASPVMDAGLEKKLCRDIANIDISALTDLME
eukprot:133212-Pyramimonas_sp.AAC.1